jgi:hypothetical protein
MQKTAQYLAQVVFEKLAVSRWREAIYSGELNTPEAEKLKAYMGKDPNQYAEALAQGTKNRLEAHGKQLDTGLNAQNAKSLFNRGGAQTDLFGNVSHSPRLSSSMMSLISMGQPKTMDRFRALADIPYTSDKRKQLSALILAHEGDESDLVRKAKSTTPIYEVANKPNWTQKVVAGTAGAASGLGIPMEATDMLRLPTSGIIQGRHMDPSVVLNEARHSRMMSPSVQNLMHNVRRVTGEANQLPTITSPPDINPKGYIPKQQIPAIADKMRATSAANLQQSFDTAARWEGRAAGAKNIASNVLNKLKGFIR